jgi:hypothetical protein
MILQERYTKVPVAGTVKWNTYSDIRGETTQLSVNPSVSTTIYDIWITDDVGSVIYKRENLRGTFVDDTKVALYGIYTINLTNTSTSNYSFTITLLWNERVRA